MLERSSAGFGFVVRGKQVGVVGLKGFVGGFPDHVLPDFGEPLLRQVYAETTEDVTTLERELTAIDGCDQEVEVVVGRRAAAHPGRDAAGDEEGNPVVAQSSRGALQRRDHAVQRVAYGRHTTLEGEPRGIWAFLGSDRLAGPIAEHSPDLVLHGHAHAGTFEGFIGRVPVYNVATYVTGKDFWIFELAVEQRPRVERPAEARAE